MSNLMAGSLNGGFASLRDNRLEVLSLLINNSCNLSCQHCYLQTSRFDDYLSPAEWNKFFASVLRDLKPSIFCFAGKEVFIDEQSVSVLVDAVKVRNQAQSIFKETQIGVITNGTLLHNYRNQLEETSPDYWDISIDGLPDVHDSVRGSGAFEMLAPNLRWLIVSGLGPVWITHTVFESNMLTLPEFIEFYHNRYGIENFAIGFYKPRSYTNQSLKLGTSDYYALTDLVLPALQKVRLDKPVRVNMEFDTSQIEMIDVLTAGGWADPVKPIASVSHEFNNGLTLGINTIRIPVGLWRAVRVTPEGYWLAAEDLINVKHYDKTVVAKLRDFDFDAIQVYKEGLKYRKIGIDAHIV